MIHDVMTQVSPPAHACCLKCRRRVYAATFTRPDIVDPGVWAAITLRNAVPDRNNASGFHAGTRHSCGGNWSGGKGGAK